MTAEDIPNWLAELRAIFAAKDDEARTLFQEALRERRRLKASRT